MQQAITIAMSSAPTSRPQSIEDFLSLLGKITPTSANTHITSNNIVNKARIIKDNNSSSHTPNNNHEETNIEILAHIIACIFLMAIVAFIFWIIYVW
jgi:hypothetical protein